MSILIHYNSAMLLYQPQLPHPVPAPALQEADLA